MWAFERRWAIAVLEGFAPAGDEAFSPHDGEVDYLGTIQRMMEASTARAALGLRLGLWMAALAPVWLLGKLKTVGGLARERRAEVLGRMLEHRSFVVRELTLLLKLSASMAMFARPALRARSGYDRAVAAVEASGERRRVRLPLAPAKAAPKVPESEVA